jgi:uncharacterized protein
MKTLLVFLSLSISLASVAQLMPFSPTDIKLGESIFLDAQHVSYRYVMAHNVDRLLAPFRREAGLAPKAPLYGNWENTGLDGHIGGHYLTALAQIVASTGDTAALNRLNYMVNELALCQRTNGNGYVGGIPGSKKLWDDVTAGNLNVHNFSLNNKWVPWYNIHKLFAGLRDAYVLADHQLAKQVLLNLSDWCYNLTVNLSDDQMQHMLIAEYGGMNEIFADVYHLTGDKKYLQLGKRFSQNSLLTPLMAHEDKLNGMHANTQIPKIIGFERVGEEMNDTAWINAAAFFWKTVVENRSVAIGGNSVREHFHPATDFMPMMEDREGPETCNTYNMMKLARLLYLRTGDKRYVDYYERAMFNHILSSQHPEHGGLVYFTSMRPRHYRVYSKAEEAFWCCVGSGMENHSKYSELIYAHTNQALYVNLYVSSTLTWREKAMIFALDADLAASDNVSFRVMEGKAQKSTINFRVPAWVNPGEVVAMINGKVLKPSNISDGFLCINRKWKKGDRVDLVLPKHVKAEMLPDGSQWTAMVYGPFVLAAPSGIYDLKGLVADDSRMGHVANGTLLPLNEAPMLVGNPNDVGLFVQKHPNELAFTFSKGIYPQQPLTLVPFYKLHDERYQVYWQVTTPADLERLLADAKAKETVRLALEANTIDHVSPGEQQPESDHNFRFDRSEAGVHRDRHWRHASGWFSYDLKKPIYDCAKLRITYFGLDNNRRFNILVNGTVLAVVTLDGKGGDTFVDVDYPISAELINLSQNKKLEVKFQAIDGSVAGGIYGVRLMKCE